jgi:hypothetical protein
MPGSLAVDPYHSHHVFVKVEPLSACIIVSKNVGRAVEHQRYLYQCQLNSKHSLR